MAYKPSKCCFCAPLRPGLLAWAYIRFILAVAFMAWSLYSLIMLAKYHMANYVYFSAINIVPCAVYLVFTVILAIGLHYENYKLLLTFLVSSLFEVAVAITMLVLQVVNIMMMDRHQPGMAREYWRQPKAYLSIVIAIVVNMLLPIYFIFVIRSEIVKIKAQEYQSKKAAEETRVVLDMPIAKEQDKRYDFVYSNPEEVPRKPLFPVEELEKLREQLGVQKV